MVLIPIHFATDIEPDETFPAPGMDSFDSAAFAFKDLFSRRAELEDATGAPVRFGWYVRMDPHVKALYGNSAVIAERYSRQFEEAALAGDEIGLHIHSFDRDKHGEWRANYTDHNLVEDAIETSVASFRAFFGRECRSARMGDMWTSSQCVAKLETLGVKYDITPESGLRPLRMAAHYPGTKSLGRRPSMLHVPSTPYQPDLANFRRPGVGQKRDIWIIPVTSGFRRDFNNPGMWLVSAYAAATSGFKNPRARMVVRPQMDHTPAALQDSLEAVMADNDPPCLCVAIRNFGVPERIHQFLDSLCEMARSRRMEFTTPAEYIRIASGKDNDPVAEPTL